MTDTLRYMQEQRYHVSMLFGVSEFYRRWGFAPVLAEHTTDMDVTTVEMPHQRLPFKMRPAKPGDIQAMQKMHAFNDADTACSLIRTQAHLANKWKQWESVRVLTDGRGKLAAYFRGVEAGSVYTIDEVGVADTEACEGVGHAAVQIAGKAGLERVRLAIPPGHPIIRHLQQYSIQRGMPTSRDTNGMMAFANLGEALESLIPEWESRLIQTPPASHHAEVTISVGRTAWRVRAHRGAVDVSPGLGSNKVGVSAQELIQLTAGCVDLDEVLTTKRRIVNAEGLALLHMMFPKRFPYVWALDRF
jgi:hypothetical protein